MTPPGALCHLLRRDSFVAAHGAHPSLQAGLPSSAFIGLHTSSPPSTSQSSSPCDDSSPLTIVGITPSRTLITFNDRCPRGLQLPQSPATCCAPSDTTHLVFSDVHDVAVHSTTGTSPSLFSVLALLGTNRAPRSTAGPLPPSRPRRAPHSAARPRKARGSRLSAQRPAAWGTSTRPGVAVSVIRITN